MRTAPAYIQFYPTQRCNRKCDFCFNQTLPDAGDMTLAAFRTMVDVLQQHAIGTLDVIGGEPTLHPDIIPMIITAKEKALHVNLSSNGTNTSLLREIMADGGVTVGVSINDRPTLVLLARFIEQQRPIVKTVFSRPLDHSLISDILALGPERTYLIFRDALSRSNLKETIPFPRYLNEVTTRFHGCPVGTVYCSGFFPDPVFPELASVRCPAGTTKLGILPDGSVYPCNLFFGHSGFLLGNILHDPFEAIWNHPALAFFRTYKRNTCPDRSCRIHDECHGGCPAQSLLLAGDLSAPDPRCIEPMIPANI